MNRDQRLVAELKKRSLDAALVHRSENMRYLTGYTGEGCVFVCEKETVIVTDFRYVEQASRQAPGIRVLATNAKHTEKDCALELTDAHGIKNLAVESDYLSYDAHEARVLHLACNGALQRCWLGNNSVL